jgi:tagaturonate epimerase
MVKFKAITATLMSKYLTLGKFSFGMGDRFAHQGKAQLQACVLATELGAEFIPVWNKSNREHTFIGTEPSSLRAEADAAVKALNWKKSYHVDADHIRLETVDRFIAPSDFFTIDVADSIGKPASATDVKTFVDRHPELIGTISIPHIDHPFAITQTEVERVANKFLLATQDAAKIYQHIAKAKGAENFITEVSMDETDSPQTPPELLIILAAIADQKIPIQTIAPKFTGRFNKGVDYVGDVKQFEKEFNEDLAVIAFAIKKYGLPPSLKLSVHSGSDKFSIYEPMRRALKKFGAGVHIKTAGTTWLEELIGLAEAGGDGLEIAKEIYAYAIEHVDEFCAPYASVIDIDKKKLPLASVVNAWNSKQFTDALRHDQKNPAYNPSFRQLLHVSFKVAAKKGDRYLNALKKHEAIVAKNVTENLFERHMKPLLLGTRETVKSSPRLEAIPA